MSGPRFELDPSVRRREGGRLLVGGVPARLLRLSEAGAAALDAILAAEDPPPCGRPLARPAGQRTTADGEPGQRTTADGEPGQRTTADGEPGQRTTAAGAAGAGATLARRLERAGTIHPLPGDGAADPPVTVVIPVLDGGEALVELVAAALREGPVIVVDDGSRDGAPARAAALGAEVRANAGAQGPAGARNTGLRAARTDLVAFLDADCAIAPGWRAGLAGLLADDPDLALVAPRVRGRPGDSPLARYEHGNCALDLGPAPSLVGPGNRVTYLPAAALVARRDALLDLGGFDETMRFGEDVDLVWRLVAGGRRARYVPSREVLHDARPDLRSFARQRFGYGASAPDLAGRHGDLAAPLRLGTHTVAVWTATALFGPRGAFAALAASGAVVASRADDDPGRRTDKNATLAARVDDGPRRRALLEESLRGQAAAGRHLLRAVAREWLPPAAALALVNRRARVLFGAALAFEIATAVRRAPSSPPQTAALRLLDHASYAAGLWTESVRRREPRALRPSLVRGFRKRRLR